MDKRLNPKHVYKKPCKLKDAIELAKLRKKIKRKGRVILHYDKYGNVAEVENREFI